MVAPALVERQLDAMIQRSRLQLAMRGIDYRSAGLDEQRMRDELRESANDEVRAAFLDRRHRREGEGRGQRRPTSRRSSPRWRRAATRVVPRLKAELQKEGRLESLKHQLREEKTLDLLLSRAKINEKASKDASSSSET